ncbi:hypothetical protein XELAEV_18004308mg [Xenopus laevis]|uniref:Uncharacterized protein n=1 Tax=Xenopus laevis TaxID=8355 RepID=A0A974BPS2_XENLA|nr:hypothetical protein XELAEV_18004308mg [Xenopus laevis]
MDKTLRYCSEMLYSLHHSLHKAVDSWHLTKSDTCSILGDREKKKSKVLRWLRLQTSFWIPQLRYPLPECSSPNDVKCICTE